MTETRTTPNNPLPTITDIDSALSYLTGNLLQELSRLCYFDEVEDKVPRALCKLIAFLNGAEKYDRRDAYISAVTTVMELLEDIVYGLIDADIALEVLELTPQIMNAVIAGWRQPWPDDVKTSGKAAA